MWQDALPVVVSHPLPEDKALTMAALWMYVFPQVSGWSLASAASRGTTGPCSVLECGGQVLCPHFRDTPRTLDKVRCRAALCHIHHGGRRLELLGFDRDAWSIAIRRKCERVAGCRPAMGTSAPSSITVLEC